ncbi:RNA polymerase sigma-70 factor [Sulfitobacter noctilucicola]|uniref:Putative membrane protein n=1 Tax=Sulfitobacter noctilucicola TaxID=1342301 RepID=A0A7W6Q6Y0_9RHOB|nr:periplasmic heavy metal sensor [Sulfitobacter noctilucicola]KIN63971.1 RNA polymerase sigma-70 factor [Sulfitobacter noctilucicola]MBB4175327.1 putative membrane protein [Sulfitobacter noctilucicola]
MDNTQSARRLPRAFKWAFGISLALNLAFVGVFAGAALRHIGDGPQKRGPRDIAQSYGTPFVRALPREARRDLRQSMRQGNPSVMSTREGRRGVYLEMAEILRADPFDADSATALLSGQSEAAQNAQARAQTAWLRIVGTMPHADRMMVADRLEEQLNERRFKKDGRKP